MGKYTKLLQQSYKKLKSSVYFDKTQLILRDKLVEFESKNNINAKFEEISNLMENDKWDELFNPIYDSVSFSAFPKEISTNSKESNSGKEGENNSHPILISNTSCDKTIIKKVQTFIDMDVIGHLMGIVWILIVGYKFDKDIYQHSYGNRLRKKLIDDNGEPSFSPYLFEPYFQQYESWRDTALNIAQTSLSQKQDVVILTLDFKRFFYSVNIDEDELIRVVQQNSEHSSLNDRIVEPLTRFVNKVIGIYSEKVSQIIPDEVLKRRVLPIGFYPSNILANYCLKKFDQEIVDGWNPLYYGRYVDDIIIVDKVENNSRLYNDARRGLLEAEKIIDYFLTNCDFWRRNDSSKCGGLLVKPTDSNTNELTVNKEFNQFKDSDIKVQNEKVKAFYFEHDQTDALIDCFRNKISKTKSEFRYLPEDEPVFGKDDYSEIYSLIETDGPNKLRGVKDIIVDKFELSKFLGKYQRISGLVHDSREKNFENSIEKVFNSQVIIENYLTWEKVLSILANNEKFDAVKIFVCRIVDSIEKLDCDDTLNPQSIESIKESLLKMLVSALNRSLSVVWGGIVESTVLELLIRINNSASGLYYDSLLRKEYCLTRMCDKYAIALLIDGFINENCLSIDDRHMMNLTSFSSIDLTNYTPDWLNNDSFYMYYPYLLTMHDLTWTNSIKNLMLDKSTSDRDDISALYNIYVNINYFSNGSILYDDLPIDFSNLSSKLPHNNYNNSIAIKIGNSKREKIKIGVANAILFDSDFENVLKQKPNRSYKRYENLTKVVNEAIANNVDLLVMPECFVPFEWVPILARTCAKNQIAIVTGVEHLRISTNKSIEDLVYNLTAVILPYTQDDYRFSYIHFHTKKHLSPEEKDTIESYRCVPKEGDSFELFCWNDFWFPVYCCYELASILDRSLFQSYADALVAVEWNRDTKYYSNIVESLSRDLHCYCIQVNTAKYGDSRITQPSKTEEKDLLNVKGGINPSVLVDTIDINNLRNFQIRGNKLQRQSNHTMFKPTPPDFDYDIVSKKIHGSLWEWIKNGE